MALTALRLERQHPLAAPEVSVFNYGRLHQQACELLGENLQEDIWDTLARVIWWETYVHLSYEIILHFEESEE